MKTATYIFFLILLSSKGLAQQSSAINTKSISYNFNNAQISAYQNNSLEKFEQFVEYFNLVQKTGDSELKKQLKESIFSLYESPETEFSDFLAKNEKIKLNQFLNQYQNSNEIIEIVSEESNKSIFQNSWINSYQIKINSGKPLLWNKLFHFKFTRKNSGKTQKKFGK